jgi:hypothetical protein
MFRVAVYEPASSPIHLDLEEGTLASETIRKALECLGINQVALQVGDLEGWRLRARRHVEEGHWWSENDIKEYSDRKFGISFSGQADYQLF